MKRRLIGETFPVKEVSEESAREKSIRQGHISTFHAWWARKPLAASRATIYASLVDPPKNIKEWGTKNQFIADLSKWENSLSSTIIKKAQKEILSRNGGVPPKILDPFGGGGSIPLESLRLGCKTYSSDVNPVAILIQKCILEYPAKYNGITEDGALLKDQNNSLLTDIKKWSNWVLDEASKEIGKFYENKNGFIPAGYITARTIACQNPNCGVEIPLMSSYWLARRPNKKIAVFPQIRGKRIQFKVVGDGYEKMPNNFEPNNGTTLNSTPVCISCNVAVDPKTLRDIFWKSKTQDKQIITITTKKGMTGKQYRPTNKNDILLFSNAEKYLKIKKKELAKKFDFEPIPDEIISTPDNKEHQQGGPYWMGTKLMLYKMTKWRDLFNSRQMLAMIVFTEKIRLAYQLMLDEGYEQEYAKAVTTYLALMLDKLADKMSNLVRYTTLRENIDGVFVRQALAMIWSYVELNPFSNNGWPNIQEWVMNVVKHCSNIKIPSTKIIQESATSLSWEDNYFDAVFTDPPYYDNVAYSTLSDFFYVWLKRSIGHLYPELFATPLTPKSEEAIATYSLLRGIDKEIAKNTIKTIKTKEDFEKVLSRSFKEIHRVLKPEGIAVIVYSHKSTDGWETLINSILDSGLLITGAWPINTERKARMSANETAALNSSIYMVTRKIKKEELGFYRDVKKNMSKRISLKLENLWSQNIRGADFFIAGIGISLEVFGKYEKIIDDSGNQIAVSRLLNDVRKIVTDFAIKQVLEKSVEGEITSMTRFYILWRLANGTAKAEFDNALKMAQSVGIDIEREYNKGFIKKDKEFIKILDPTERKMNDIGTDEMVDVLHKALLLWKKSKHGKVAELLKETGFGGSDVFYKVAQAISEANPGSQESRLIDGFMSSKNSIIASMPKKGKKITDY